MHVGYRDSRVKIQNSFENGSGVCISVYYKMHFVEEL